MPKSQQSSRRGQDNVYLRLERLDEAFGLGRKDLGLRISERAVLIEAIDRGDEDRIPPDLARRGRAWARAVMTRRLSVRRKLLLVLLAAVYCAVYAALMSLRDSWPPLLIAVTVNILLQAVIGRRDRRTAEAFLAALPPTPTPP